MGLPKPTGLDRAIGWAFPKWGLKRIEARTRLRLGAALAYEGARRDRLNQDWLGLGDSADAALLDSLPTLRNRCRELVRNNSIARSIINSNVRNVIGCGLRPEPQIDAKVAGVTPERARELRKMAEQIFRDWVKEASVDERQHFFGIQRLIQRAKCTDGEGFANIAMVQRPGRRFETSVEVIEADRIETPGGQDDNKVRAGVVLGGEGQPVAYWVLRQHPGDDHLARSGGNRKFRRMRAWDGRGGRRFVHLARWTRPGATRGEPLLAPVMNDLRDIGSFLEAERIAKRIESCWAGFIERDPMAWGLIGDTPEAGKRPIPIEPGIFEQLMPGEKITFPDSKRPGNTFEPYLMLMIRTIGAGVEMPLEIVLMDYSESSWSNARAAVLETRRGWQCEQDDLVWAFCQPCYEAVLEEAWLKGDFPVSDFYGMRQVWTAAEWIPDGWEWVDPVKEATSSKLSMEIGVSNLAIESAKQGRNWRSVVRQAAEIEKETREIRDELGLANAPAPGDANAEAGDKGSEGDDGEDQDQDEKRETVPAGPPEEQDGDQDDD